MYNKIHFTYTVEIRILIYAELLIDIAMYSITRYTDLVEIRHGGISVIFISSFSFPWERNKPEIIRLLMMFTTLRVITLPVADNQNGNLRN